MRCWEGGVDGVAMLGADAENPVVSKLHFSQDRPCKVRGSRRR